MDEPMTFKSVEQGAATSVWAASPQLKDLGGLYLEDCQIAGAAAPGKPGGVAACRHRPATADRLWRLSETLVGQSFPGISAVATR